MAAVAAAERLAERVQVLAKPVSGPPPTHEPLEFPTPPADADLNATEGVLMAGVTGELRVIVSALAGLERVTVRTTKHEAVDQAKADAAVKPVA